MTDDQNAAPVVPPSSADPSTGSAAADPNTKSPLDILEELLDKTKQDAAVGAPAPGDGVATQEASSADDPAAVAAATAEAEAQRLAEIQAQAVQQAAEDQAKMQAMGQELASIADTPQYQARVEQQQQEEQEKANQQADLEGHEIRQIGHTTV